MQTEVETKAEDRVVTPRFSRTRRGILFVALPALALASVAGVMSSARAAGPAGDEAGGPGPMRRMHRILDRVGATQGQRDQIRAIWTGLRPQLRAARAEHQNLRQQMVGALTAPSINAADVERLRKQAMTNADKISSLMTQGIVASAQVLTPEQRKLAQQEIANGGGRHMWGPAAP
jgi:periplasmic protein CpxP/Spy